MYGHHNVVWATDFPKNKCVCPWGVLGLWGLVILSSWCKFFLLCRALFYVLCVHVFQHRIRKDLLLLLLPQQHFCSTTHIQSRRGFLHINYIFVPQMSGNCEMRFISAAYSLSLWPAFIWCGCRRVGWVDGFILYSCAESSLADRFPWYHFQLNSSFGAVFSFCIGVWKVFHQSQYFNQFLQSNMYWLKCIFHVVKISVLP